MAQAYTMPMHADQRLRSGSGAGVDHVAVSLGLGRKAVRVSDPAKSQGASTEARALRKEHRAPVDVEVMLERVTNIAMGAEIDNINEFEPVTVSIDDAPTSVVARSAGPSPSLPRLGRRRGRTPRLPPLGAAGARSGTRPRPARSYNRRIPTRSGAPPCRA